MSGQVFQVVLDIIFEKPVGFACASGNFAEFVKRWDKYFTEEVPRLGEPIRTTILIESIKSAKIVGEDSKEDGHNA